MVFLKALVVWVTIILAEILHGLRNGVATADENARNRWTQVRSSMGTYSHRSFPM